MDRPPSTSGPATHSARRKTSTIFSLPNLGFSKHAITAPPPTAITAPSRPSTRSQTSSPKLRAISASDTGKKIQNRAARIITADVPDDEEPVSTRPRAPVLLSTSSLNNCPQLPPLVSPLSSFSLSKFCDDPVLQQGSSNSTKPDAPQHRVSSYLFDRPASRGSQPASPATNNESIIATAYPYDRHSTVHRSPSKTLFVATHRRANYKPSGAAVAAAASGPHSPTNDDAGSIHHRRGGSVSLLSASPVSSENTPTFMTNGFRINPLDAERHSNDFISNLEGEYSYSQSYFQAPPTRTTNLRPRELISHLGLGMGATIPSFPSISSTTHLPEFTGEPGQTSNDTTPRPVVGKRSSLPSIAASRYEEEMPEFDVDPDSSVSPVSPVTPLGPVTPENSSPSSNLGVLDLEFPLPPPLTGGMIGPGGTPVFSEDDMTAMREFLRRRWIATVIKEVEGGEVEEKRQKRDSVAVEAEVAREMMSLETMRNLKEEEDEERVELETEMEIVGGESVACWSVGLEADFTLDAGDLHRESQPAEDDVSLVLRALRSAPRRSSFYAPVTAAPSSSYEDTASSLSAYSDLQRLNESALEMPPHVPIKRTSVAVPAPTTVRKASATTETFVPVSIKGAGADRLVSTLNCESNTAPLIIKKRDASTDILTTMSTKSPSKSVHARMESVANDKPPTFDFKGHKRLRSQVSMPAVSQHRHSRSAPSAPAKAKEEREKLPWEFPAPPPALPEWDRRRQKQDYGYQSPNKPSRHHAWTSWDPKAMLGRAGTGSLSLLQVVKPMISPTFSQSPSSSSQTGTSSEEFGYLKHERKGSRPSTLGFLRRHTPRSPSVQDVRVIRFPLIAEPEPEDKDIYEDPRPPPPLPTLSTSHSLLPKPKHHSKNPSVQKTIEFAEPPFMPRTRQVIFASELEKAGVPPHQYHRPGKLLQSLSGPSSAPAEQAISWSQHSAFIPHHAKSPSSPATLYQGPLSRSPVQQLFSQEQLMLVSPLEMAMSKSHQSSRTTVRTPTTPSKSEAGSVGFKTPATSSKSEAYSVHSTVAASSITHMRMPVRSEVSHLGCDQASTPSETQGSRAKTPVHSEPSHGRLIPVPLQIDHFAAPAPVKRSNSAPLGMLVHPESPAVVQQRSHTPQALGPQHMGGVSKSYVNGDIDGEETKRKRQSTFGAKIGKAVRSSGIVGWTKGWGKKS